MTFVKHAKQIKKPISFFLALITACLFVGQGIVFDSANVEAAEDSFKLFGIDTDMTAKEFAENIGIYAKAMSGYKYGLTGTRYDSSETTLDCVSFVELVYKLACGTAKGKGSSGLVSSSDNWRSDIKYYKDPNSTNPINISSWTVTAKDIYGLCKPYSHNLRAFRSDVLDNAASGVSHTSFTDVKNAKYYSDRIIDGDPSVNKSEADSAWKSLLSKIKYSDGSLGASNGDIMIFYEDGCDSYSDVALHVGIYYEIDGVPGLYHCSDSKGVTYVKEGNNVSYKVTKDSSTGHYGVRWEALSSGISKDVALTHMAAYKTVDQEYPVRIGFLINKTFKDYLFTGAEFTVYEEDKKTVRGKITDNDGNGVYSNYKDVSGDAFLYLGKVSSDSTSISKTFYISESKVPADVITDSGSFRAKEEYGDKGHYKVEVSYKSQAQDPDTGTLTYKVSGGNLKESISKTVSSYSAVDSYKDNGNKVRLANDSGDYLKFHEALWLSLTKKTNDEKIYDTKVTKLTLRKADNTALAHYMYSDSGWGWYLNDGATYYGKYYPLMADTDYKVTETYSVPVFHCYEGKTLSYKVSNADWQDKTYRFSTKGKALGEQINIVCTNTVDSSVFSLKKSVNYGTKEYFSFALLTKDRSKILAKGISDSKGIVIWKYYGTSSTELTESDSIILPAGSYRLEETVPQGQTTSYGGIMHYAVPKGFKEDPSGKYFYREITVDDNGLELTVDNNLPYGSISGNKSAPKGNQFDISKVSFSLYYDKNNNGTADNSDSLITTGTVDKNGSIIWKDDVKHLSYGRYVVSEKWDPLKFAYSDGSYGYYVSHNESGWNKKSDCCYEKAFEIDDGHRSFSFNVVNSEDSSELSLTKTFLSEGDLALTDFELLYKGKVIAQGTAKSDGKSGYSTLVTWTYEGKKVQTLKVPAGEYEIREYIPEVYYKKTGIRFSYATPEGWSRSEDGKYFYKKITVARDVPCKADAANVLQKGDLTVKKIDEAAETDKEFVFNIYWRGNGNKPEDIGRFDDDHLLDTIKVKTRKKDKGVGFFTLKNVPYGFYEIKEDIPEGYSLVWNNSSDYNGIVHVDGKTGSNDGIITGTNKINVTVRAVKTDEWTGKIIVDPGAYSPERSLKYTLYDDLNSNGFLDSNELPSGREITDLDNDGIIMFPNVGKGDYLLKETGSIDGYFLSDVVLSFSVETPQDIVLYPEDEPYAVPLKITKIDKDDQRRLSGAEFELYVDSNNNLRLDEDDKNALVMVDGKLTQAIIKEIEKGVYECNGLLHFNDGSAEFGHSYILFEKSAPEGYFFVSEDGYTKDNTTVVFTVDAQDCDGKDFILSPKVYTVENKTGSVSVHKSSEEGVLIPGAVFDVYKDEECHDMIGRLSDNNGIYSYKGLDVGKYYLVESEAPEGYERDPEVYPFEIKYDDPDVVVENALAGKYKLEGKFVNCSIHTSARDKRFSNEYEMMLSADGSAVIVDKVYFDGLIKGVEYELEGTVLYAKDYTKADGSLIKAGSVFRSNEGKAFSSKWSFVAGKDGKYTLSANGLTVEGYVEISIPVDPELLSEILVPVVISEKMYRKDTGVPVGSHNDLNAVRQMLIPVDVSTELTADDSKSHIVKAGADVELKDRIECRNLSCGKRYKITGILLDTDTGEKILDRNGKEISSEVIFTLTKENAKNISGYDYLDENGRQCTEYLADIDVVVPFRLNTDDLDGRSITAFEYLYVEEKKDFVKIAGHEDINDDHQTVICEKKIPEIKTVLIDSSSNTKTVSYGNRILLTDKISYRGLITGLTYTMEGMLFDKTAGDYLKDNGKPVAVNVDFVPETESGTVDMSFTVDSTLIKGHDLVAFQTLWRNAVVVASHCDEGNPDQTVTVPSCMTCASTEQGTKVIESMRKAVIIDSVEYKGLTPGKKYCIVASLYSDKGAGLVRKDGSLLEKKVSFVPEKADGKVDVSISFSNNLLDPGTVIVVFEDIYLNDYLNSEEDVLVTCHRDLTCKEQSIAVRLPATGERENNLEKVFVLLLMIFLTSLFLDLKDRRHRCL